MPDDSSTDTKATMRGTGPSRFELIFVTGLIIALLLVSLGFVLLSVLAGYGFPSTFVAILLGLAIAAAVYRFLGGVTGTEFKVGAAKLAGSAALFGIVFYLVEGPLEKNMNDVEAIADGRSAQTKLRIGEQKTLDEKTGRQKAELRAAELEAGATVKQSDTVEGTLAQVRRSTAGDSLGKGVLRLQENRQGPWQRQALNLQARFLHSVPKGTFWFCHDRRPDLHGKSVQFELVNTAAGTSEKITLQSGGDIGLGICQNLTFDVQLGCDAAIELLKLECSAQRGVAWPEGDAKRTFDLVTTM